MQLYRLDSDSGPVTDLIGPVLFRTHITARDRARAVAKQRGEPVTLTTITARHARLVPTLTIHPDGRAKRIHRPRK